MPYLILALILLAGCTRTVHTTTTVEVPGPIQYLEIPPSLLAPCTNTDAPETNGELLQSWERLRLELAICNAQIESIKGLSHDRE